MRVARASFALSAAAALLSARPSAAQTPTPIGNWQFSPGVVLEPLEGPVPDWRAVIGAGGVVQPTFPGAKRYRLIPFPALDIRYKELAFLSDAEGLGVNLLHGPAYRAGAALSYDVGRSARDDPHLSGLSDVGFAPEAKLFAAYTVFPVVIKLDLRRAVGGHGGTIGDVGFYLPVHASGGVFAFIGPSLTLADDRYMRAYFGVGPLDAARSGLRSFDARGGLKGARLGASVFWAATAHWIVGVDAAVERFLGSAAASPIVETKFQAALAAILGYRF